MDYSATHRCLPPAPVGADAGAARAEWRLRVLDELAGIGAALCREIGLQVRDGRAAQTRGGTAAFALAFERVARAVRMTIALSCRLEADPHLLAGLGAGAPARAARDGAQDGERAESRAEEVELRDTETAERPDEERPERAERLDDPSIDAELGNRPFGAIVQEICRAVGVACDANQFTAEEMGVAGPRAAHGSVAAAGAGDVAVAEVAPGPRQRDSRPPAREGAPSADNTTPGGKSWAERQALRRAQRRMGAGRDPP